MEIPSGFSSVVRDVIQRGLSHFSTEGWKMERNRKTYTSSISLLSIAFSWMYSCHYRRPWMKILERNPPLVIRISSLGFVFSKFSHRFLVIASWIVLARFNRLSFALENYLSKIYVPAIWSIDVRVRFNFWHRFISSHTCQPVECFGYHFLKIIILFDIIIYIKSDYKDWNVFMIISI